MKLSLSKKKITITFLISFLVAAALLFSILFNLFLRWPWDYYQYLIIGVFLALSIVFYILSLKANYYIVEKGQIKVRRFTKLYAYNFKEVIYIDEDYSTKHKTVMFVTSKGHIRYLTFDSQGILYETMLEKCTNRVDLATVRRRFPNLKL